MKEFEQLYFDLMDRFISGDGDVLAQELLDMIRRILFSGDLVAQEAILNYCEEDVYEIN